MNSKPEFVWPSDHHKIPTSEIAANFEKEFYWARIDLGFCSKSISICFDRLIHPTSNFRNQSIVRNQRFGKEFYWARIDLEFCSKSNSTWARFSPLRLCSLHCVDLPQFPHRGPNRIPKKLRKICTPRLANGHCRLNPYRTISNLHVLVTVKLRSRIGVHGISNFFRNFPLFFPKNIDFLQIFWEKCMKTCKNCQNPRKNRKFSKKIGIFW